MADIAQNLTPRRVLASLRRTCPAGSRRVLQSPVKALQTNVVPTVILYLPAGTRGAYNRFTYAREGAAPAPSLLRW